MAIDLFANNPSATVTAGGQTAPTAGTSETWEVADSSPFPDVSPSGSPPTQFRVVDPDQPTEVILVTHTVGTTWTVTRGTEGTAPVLHAVGFTIYGIVSAAALAAFLRAGGDIGGTPTAPQVTGTHLAAPLPVAQGGTGLAAAGAHGQVLTTSSSGTVSWAKAPVDWVNVVTTYGADPTGVADSTTAIQNALNAATAGYVVYLPTGTYKTSTVLTVPTGVSLYGPSRTMAYPGGNYGIGGVPIQGAIIRPAGSVTAAVQFASNGVTQYGNQSLRNLTIDGSAMSGGTGHGILADAVAGVTLRDVTVVNVIGDGLHGAGVAGTGFHPPDFWDVLSCKFSLCGGWGVNIAGLADSFFTNCETTASVAGGGWSITNCGNTRFTGCKGEQNGAGPGWLLTAQSGFTGQVLLTGCTSQNNGQDGYRVTGSAAPNAVYKITDCSSTGDGINGGSGGGGYAALQVTSFSGTVLAPGFAVALGTSPACPQYGVSMASSGTTIVDIAALSGATSATHDGGGNTVFQTGVGAGLLTALGDTTYRGSTGLARLAPNTTATKKFLTQTGNGSVSAAPGWNTIVAGDLPTLDLIPAAAASVGLNSQKITSLANGSATADAAAFGQVPVFPTPAQMGILAWSYPVLLSLGGTSAATSGVVYVIRIPLYGASISVTNVIVGVQTAGSTLTSSQNFAGLYDNTGTKLGGTADQTANWGSTGLKTMALTGGPFSTSATFAYAVIVTNGTTPPAFARLGGGNAAQSLITLSSSGSSMPFASNGSGATALPASLTYSSNSATSAQPFWVGLS